MMQLVVTGEKPRLQQTAPAVKQVQTLTVGKSNLWRHHVMLASKQPVGMFTLIESRRP